MTRLHGAPVLRAHPPKPSRHTLATLVLVHIALIIASNYLVQIPFEWMGVQTTWGAFTFPLVFVATDLTVRLLGQGMEPLANFSIGGEGAAIGVQTWGVVEDGRVGEARCHFRPVGQVGQGACQWSQRGTDHGRRRRPIGGAWHRRGQHHTRAGHGRRGLFLAAGRRNLAHRRRGTAGIAIGPGGERGAGTACQQCAGQGCSHERAGPGARAAGGRRAGNLREAHAWTTVPWRRHMGPG